MLCEKLELFFDGELPPEDAALVRQHTADCSRCQRELHAMMQLQALNLALVEERAQRRDTPVASSRPVGATITPLRPRIYRTVLAASVAVAAAAAALLWFRQDRAAGPELASITPLPGLGSTRAIEGRLSYGGADLYRPYEVQRASGTAVEHGIPLAALAKLEERGDVHGIAAAHLLMGSRSQAEHYLDSAHNEPALAVDVESDRALLALLDSDPENALQILDRALEQEPQHPQALWNRALALRDLGLPLLAAEAFERVTALNEPGWYQEARAQAERLRRTASEQEAAWDIVLARSRAFARTGAGVSVNDVAHQPGLVRNYFYDAVRVAHTREQLDALRPIASALDEVAGGRVLGDHLDRVSRSDLGRRRGPSQAFAELIAADQPAPRAVRALVEAARAAAIADIELGAMRHTGAARRQVAEDLLPAYQALASASGDPWFVLLAAEEVAQARIERGDYAGAEHVLGQALPTCESARIEYRCIRIDYWLGAAYVGLHRVSDARRHLMDAWATAQRAGDWSVQQGLLQQLSESRVSPGRQRHRQHCRGARLSRRADAARSIVRHATAPAPLAGDHAGDPEPQGRRAPGAGAGHGHGRGWHLREAVVQPPGGPGTGRARGYGRQRGRSREHCSASGRARGLSRAGRGQPGQPGLCRSGRGQGAPAPRPRCRARAPAPRHCPGRRAARPRM